MEFLNDFVSNALLTLPPLVRDIGIFILSYAEGLPVIGSLVPGGTVALIIGSLTNKEIIAPMVAINLIAIGSFLGDITGFLLGKQMRKLPWVKRLIEREDHQKHWDIFDRHIALVIIFGKLLPVIRSTPSLLAGTRNIPKWRYILYVAIGSYLWSIVGIYGGNAIANFAGDNAIALIVGVVLFITLIPVGFGQYKKHKRKKHAKQQSTEPENS